MATNAKSIGTAATGGLRLVVVGQGETRGRRPHLLRLREGLMQELKTVADGQMYLLVEVAVRRFIDDLKTRPAGIEVIQVQELEPGPKDEHLLDQRAARTAKKASTSAKLASSAREHAAETTSSPVKPVRARKASTPSKG